MRRPQDHGSGCWRWRKNKGASGGAWPQRADRAGDGRPGPSEHPAASNGSALSGVQDSRWLRLPSPPPVINKAQAYALATGDSWLAQGVNVLLFGPPGSGKCPAGKCSAGRRRQRLAHAHDRPSNLVQKLRPPARARPGGRARPLDKYNIVPDDLTFIPKDQAEAILMVGRSTAWRSHLRTTVARQWDGVFHPALTIYRITC